MACRGRAQLDGVHRLAGVHLHVEPHAVGHRDAVRRDGAKACARERVPHLGGLVHDALPVVAAAGLVHGLGHDVAVVRRERLPLEGQHAMALQVAERAVVAEHVETVRRALERAARLVPPVRAMADVRRQHRLPLALGHPACDVHQLGVRQVRHRVERGGDDLGLARRVVVGQRDLGHQRRLDAVEGLRRHGASVLAGRLEIAAPGDAAVLLVDAGQERRDDLAQLGQHHVGVVPRLGQRARPQPQEERLVPLPRAEDADVGVGRGGQEAAQAVEGLRPDGALVDALGRAFFPRVAGHEVLFQGLDPTGVGRERVVQHLDKALPHRVTVELGGHHVLPQVAGPVRVRT